MVCNSKTQAESKICKTSTCTLSPAPLALSTKKIVHMCLYWLLGAYNIYPWFINKLKHYIITWDYVMLNKIMLFNIQVFKSWFKLLFFVGLAKLHSSTKYLNSIKEGKEVENSFFIRNIIKRAFKIPCTRTEPLTRKNNSKLK